MYTYIRVHVMVPSLYFRSKPQLLLFSIIAGEWQKSPVLWAKQANYVLRCSQHGLAVYVGVTALESERFVGTHSARSREK